MKIFDSTPKKGTPVGAKIFFLALLRMARAWERLNIVNGHVSWSNGIPSIVFDAGISGTGGASDMTLRCELTDDAEVTVRAGSFRIGKKNISVSETAVNITLADTYIFVLHEKGTAAATVESSTTNPQDSDTHIRWPLAKWTLTGTPPDEKAEVVETHHVGDIKISTNYGAD